MSSASEEHIQRTAAPGRPWGIAFLVWAGVCCTLSPVLLVELQLHGLEHFSTATGSREVSSFLRNVVFYPGLVLPALVVLVPRLSVALCGLLLAGCIALLAITSFRDAPLVHTFAFWGSGVLPVVLAAIATVLAYRRRDWRPMRSAASGHER